jgi:hypothetical protein
MKPSATTEITPRLIDTMMAASSAPLKGECGVLLGVMIGQGAVGVELVRSRNVFVAVCKGMLATVFIGSTEVCA